MLNSLKSLLKALCVVSILISLWTFSGSINDHFTLDEVEEAEFAELIPKIGAQTWFDEKGEQKYGVTHPLLYTYTLALHRFLFGPSEIALRSYGLIFFLLTYFIILLTASYLFRKNPEQKVWSLYIITILYFLNPLLIQHALMLNADNNISAFLIACFIYCFIRFEHLKGRQFIWSRFALLIVVALNFWAKEITPIFLLFAVIIYRVLNRDFKRLFFDLVITIFLGTALFWGTWMIFCSYTKIDVMSFLNFTLIGKSQSSLQSDHLLIRLKQLHIMWRWPIYWASAPFFILILLLIIRRIKRFRVQKRLETYDFLICAAIVMWLPYQVIRASLDMMKYQYPAYPIFVTAIAGFTYTALFEKRDGKDIPLKMNKAMVILVPGLLVFLGIYYWIVGDYILVLPESMRSPQYRFLLLYYAPIIASPLIIYMFAKKYGFHFIVILCSLILIVPISSALNLRQRAAAYTTIVSWGNYGERGLPETVDYLKTRIDSTARVVLRRDVKFYLKYRHGITPAFTMRPYHLPAIKNEVLEKIISNQGLEYIVFDSVTMRLAQNEFMLKLLKEHYVLDQTFGDFFIMKKR